MESGAGAARDRRKQKRQKRQTLRILPGDKSGILNVKTFSEWADHKADETDTRRKTQEKSA